MDGCYFDGGDVLQPRTGVVFNTSSKGRLSNCTGNRLLDQLAWFDGACRDCLEMCNSETEAEAAGTIVRIKVEDPRFISMSRRGMGVPAVASELDLPDPAAAGSLVWVNTIQVADRRLKLWNGSEWKNVTLS